MSTDPDRRARFEGVAAQVYEPVQRYLRRRATADDAADALADVMLVVWRRLDDVPAEPLPWCYGIARRCLANQRRSETRRLRLVEEVGSHSDPDAGALFDPQRRVETSDPDLTAAIDTLSESEAEIVRLWAWEQLEPREIAGVLDITANAVSVSLARAKRKLRDQLDHESRQDPARAGHIQGARTNGWKGEHR